MASGSPFRWCSELTGAGGCNVGAAASTSAPVRFHFAGLCPFCPDHVFLDGPDTGAFNTTIGMNIPSGNTHRACACLLFAVTLACLSGCTTIGVPRGDEAAAIQQKHKTIVLARVVCTNDAQVQQRPTCDFTLNSWLLGDATGRMETSPFEKLVLQRSLSKSLRDQGWFYVVMDPGTYCLKMNPRVNSVSQPVFYLSIPANKQLLYAGTVVFDRKTVKQGKKDVTKLSMNRILDESPAAKTTIANEFAGFGEMTPRLLALYDKPPVNYDHVIHVERSPAGGHATPSVKGDNLFTATIIEAPGLVLLAGASGSSGDGAAYAAAAGLTYMVAVAPLALASWEITAHAHHKKWAPYEATLQKQVALFHPEEKLQQALASRMSITGTNSTGVPVLRLEAQPYRIVLRGDEHQKFNLELAARVRLLDPADGSAIWEHNYVYSCPAADQSADTSFETIVPSDFGRHKLEEYRGDAGAKLMQDELNSAVDGITGTCAAAVLLGNPDVTEETPPQSPH